MKCWLNGKRVIAREKNVDIFLSCVGWLASCCVLCQLQFAKETLIYSFACTPRIFGISLRCNNFTIMCYIYSVCCICIFNVIDHCMHTKASSSRAYIHSYRTKPTLLPRCCWCACTSESESKLLWSKQCDSNQIRIDRCGDRLVCIESLDSFNYILKVDSQKQKKNSLSVVFLPNMKYIKFLLILLFAVCIQNSFSSKLDEKFHWKEVSYAWPSESIKEEAIKSGRYQPENNLPLGLEVCLFVYNVTHTILLLNWIYSHLYDYIQFNSI